MVALGVHLRRCYKHTLRAELYAQFTAFTAIRNQIDLAARDMDFRDVERHTIEYSHLLILSIRLPPLLLSHYTRDMI
jgi:hypothetical protein